MRFVALYPMFGSIICVLHRSTQPFSTISVVPYPRRRNLRSVMDKIATLSNPYQDR